MYRWITRGWVLALLFAVHPAPAEAANTYCASSSSSTSYEFIDSIDVNGVTFASGNDGGYFEHTSEVAPLVEGTNSLTLVPGYPYGSYPEYWSVWLDLDGDGVFAASELVAQTNGAGTQALTFELAAGAPADPTGMRISMRFGGPAPACGSFSWGEVEDFTAALDASTGEPELPSYHLTLEPDFTVRRNGSIGDAVTWVFERNGSTVLRRNAAGELEYRYYANSAGNDFEVYLEQFIDGSYQRVSNVLEYTPGITDLYTLSLLYDFEAVRSGSLGSPVIWVIEEDGEIVLERNAANELSYTYFGNTSGSEYRIWLKQYIGGQYEIVSNTLEYEVGQTEFDLTVDAQFDLRRNGQLGDAVQWLIEEDGQVVLERNAANELEYTYFANQPGSSYRVWLQMFLGGAYQVVSNVVSYSVPASYPFQLQVGPNYLIQRSGVIGDPVVWVIVKDGTIVLKRNAANEVQYTYFNNTPGSSFEVYLEQFIDGFYQPVSASVFYTVP